MIGMLGTPLLDIPFLDTEHEELDRNLKRLAACESARAALQVVDAVILQWSLHSGKEEVHMQHFKYAHLNEHSQAHVAMLHNLYAIAESLTTLGVEQVSTAADDLARLLHGHILNHDAKFAEFLRGKNV